MDVSFYGCILSRGQFTYLCTFLSQKAGLVSFAFWVFSSFAKELEVSKWSEAVLFSQT